MKEKNGVEDGFRVRTIQYLVKPYTEYDLEALLVEIMKRLPVTASYIDLRPEGRTALLPMFIMERL